MLTFDFAKDAPLMILMSLVFDVAAAILECVQPF